MGEKVSNNRREIIRPAQTAEQRMRPASIGQAEWQAMQLSSSACNGQNCFLCQTTLSLCILEDPEFCGSDATGSRLAPARLHLLRRPQLRPVLVSLQPHSTLEHPPSARSNKSICPIAKMAVSRDKLRALGQRGDL
ncbi:unnamed protein product [Protopolystoma xenopodis]|uniref:Uncharacterized protein n=1 Tax=Protopolystoma xenopodis TaxID=117903 RepID=A0A448WDY1_9PLAT|nr:unnamed protein product [Protopolystoma xenopodis]